MIWVIIGILVLALVVLVLLIVRAKRQEEQEAMRPVEDLAALSVADARKGDTISVVGAGDDYDDLTFTVDRVYHYQSGGDRWFELSGNYRGRRVFVEVEEDDQLQVTVNTAREDLTLAQLGLDEQRLIEFDEAQDRSNTIEYDGARWRYESSTEVVGHEDGSSEEEGFYGWDFRELDGDRVLFVEKYEGEPFEVGIGKRVHPDDVRVFRA